MTIKPIRNEADYEAALVAIEAFFDNQPAPGTPEADEFDVLATLIEAYEDKHWPIDLPDPVEAIEYKMQMAGYKQADLAKVLGSRSRASEVLRRKRALSLEMAYRLHQQWHIPAEVLLKPYHLKTA